ncbi:glycoside hydrolase superfamily [Neohortaea acidophila]|uniref:Beta-hexosaminidase n=1 Tax=Neohortaea acidophila TaxID=245834 RepID=A0A6A6PZJ1_9PEZI|nr:glycoside hydrolase superfamily [Neohortaea acidophila]KAF2485628.1 glycoside hydrolase superfamily [Neohortaea acidophila]
MVSTSKELPIWPQPTLTEFGTHTSPLLTGSDLTYSVTNVDALPREPQAHREEFGRRTEPARHNDDPYAQERVRNIFSRGIEFITSQAKFKHRSTMLRGYNEVVSPPADSHPRRHQHVSIEQLTITQPITATFLEWYKLRVDVDGNCHIQIASLLALNRAMATFVQLFYGAADSAIFCPYCPLLIEDSPQFQHRGLNIDLSRNVMLPSDIGRVIDGLWLNKFNRLHLHATDSQSWPLEIPSIPELAKKGAYHESQIWTASDLREVQKYGFERGIEVYVEVDMPGHTASIYHSHPELIVGYKMEPVMEYALQPPAGTLKLKSNAAREFIQRLLDDLLPRVREYSDKFHLGGDELNLNCYKFEEGLESNSKEVLRPLVQSFYDMCLSKLEKHDARPMLWEEMLLEWDINFPSSTIFQAWRSQESLGKIVERGHYAIFSPCHRWYLDTGLGTFMEPDPDNPDTPVKYPFEDWCPPFKNWRTVYTYDPFEGIADKDRHLLLGGEVSLWCELTDGVTVDTMVWPRAAAAAEVLWSGSGQLDESVTRRLAGMRERLVRAGIRAGMVQTEWALRNPGSSYM